MFRRVFDTARSYLSRSPSFQKSAHEELDTGPVTRQSLTVEMVTSTRRGPVDSTPRSSARKTKRPFESEETPTGANKRRREVGEKGSALKEVVTESPAPKRTSKRAAGKSATEESTEEPTQTKQPGSAQKKLPLKRRSSPKVVVQKQSSPAVEESKEDAQQAEATEEVTVPESGKKKQTKKQGKKGAKNAVSEEPKEAQKPAPPVNAKIRFGSEEPVETLTLTENVPAVKPPAAEPQDDDYESDSDEAPEEVTASSALTKAKAAEADAARAQKAQQEKEEQKRKERAERVAEEQRAKQKRIAEEQKKQRIREEREAKKQATMDAASRGPALDVDMQNLPALLPDSLLEAVGDTRPPTPPRALTVKDDKEKRKEKLNRHIKFLERGEKRIKDLKRGKLNVHVLEQSNSVLGPKVNKDSRNIREKWLKGRQQEKKKVGKGKMHFSKMERRPVGGGFLRGGDD
ncbi:hypothetical protein M011DRAFT_473806 [Sporormia fimetaria CBS 119925]|uniref:Uncharacterized protein n=1 Tax=Sporormia fimetaria CBS 119925 TaxID=1340428 RepID=A0A6A6VL20_9PLEO|nr:hypothetical protein M011DRAFT_473806 [Sporormia fimetaria CBS 119925]